MGNIPKSYIKLLSKVKLKILVIIFLVEITGFEILANMNIN
jgi:hypothetical protein